MQSLLLPVARTGAFPAAAVYSSDFHLSRFHCRPFSVRGRQASDLNSPSNSLPSLSAIRSSSSSSLLLSKTFGTLEHRRGKFCLETRASSSSISPTVPPIDEAEKLKLAQVAKRLEKTSRYFKRLGNLGFWGQLVLTVVAAVILSFSVVITGKITSPATFYATAGGIVAAFISVFWSFGYIRLSDKLRRTANQPSKAPPRADVVNSLKNGIVMNLLGMGAAILGMQATVGLLVAKALTSSATPYFQAASPGNSPVLALDVFLVQASANTILSHFLGLVFSLELLRSVTLPAAESIRIPQIA
ncbi:protein TIC 21, chloroplastic-like [Cucurbita pepo subsp. pepo]|uniref:protein TIC 21, chloroplastic-like n=1 Tax=Cucurbita pepo subsp. pepo TaxID=3664 RepID=UPI000C9D8E98|nr:protein TIC 21, chloroplastic-like [Cucurbita pepo subsp. pepo]